MNHRLIYVIGPSGAGKDSLMKWVQDRLPESSSVFWARRLVTRPKHESSGYDMALDLTTFEDLLANGELALHWQANGLHYGIKRSELAPLACSGWVFVNGSRAFLPTCASLYPGLTIVHITADPEVLRQRLLHRGRENLSSVNDRMDKRHPLAVPPMSRWIEVHNNQTLDQAGQRLLEQLEQWPDWPTS